MGGQAKIRKSKIGAAVSQPRQRTSGASRWVVRFAKSSVTPLISARCAEPR